MPGTETKSLGAVVMAAGLGRACARTPKHSSRAAREADGRLGTGDRSRAGAEPVDGRCSAGDGRCLTESRSRCRRRSADRRRRRVVRTLLDGVDDVLVPSATRRLTPQLLRDLVETHRREAAWATVLSFEPEDPREYGRIVRNGSGGVAEIVEAVDATPEQLAVREVNSSIYVFRAERLWPVLERSRRTTRRVSSI